MRRRSFDHAAPRSSRPLAACRDGGRVSPAPPFTFVSAEIRRWSTLDDAAEHVAARQFALFIEEAARVARSDTFGVEVGSSYDVRASGLSAYVSISAATVREALRNACRYGSISDTSADYALTEGEHAASFRVESRSPDLRRSRQAVEFKVAILLEACRRWVGPGFRPLEVRFALARSAALREVERTLGCPVNYGTEVTEVILAPEQLDQPTRSADHYLLELLERVADTALATRGREGDSFRSRVERLLLPALPKGVPTARAVAAALGVGERTLARRLAAEGASFAQVLEEMRHDMALSYLEDPGISLAQIAYLLGYADQSAFSNAFRRWTGASPSRFRAGPRLAAVGTRE